MQSPLDAYSQIVVGVAAELTGKVASLRVPRQGRPGRGGESLGSAVVYTSDGFLLTNAHVVGDAPSGTASFGDGTSVPFTTVGADPLSDLAVVRASGPPSSARRTNLSSASSWWPWATRSAWPARSPRAW
jgi:S1-C subfamily serine protease